MFFLSLLVSASCFYSFTATPENVYDGDTIKDVVIKMDFGITATKTIRILGIDAPEMRGGSDREKRKATKARDRLRNIIGSCTKLRLVGNGNDNFGRLLANVFCGNTDIAKQLLREGHAVEYKK